MGAQFPARCGIHVWRVLILARWAGRSIAQYAAGPLDSSLASEAALGRDLCSARQALATARARLLEVADVRKPGATQAAIDDALGDYVEKAVGTPAAALPKPSVTDIVGARVKGWHREPLQREVFPTQQSYQAPPLAESATGTGRGTDAEECAGSARGNGSYVLVL